MENCEFCAIAVGEAPALAVWQDARSLAFFPLHPAAVGHTLLIPKVHYDDLFHMPDLSLTSLVQAVARVGRGLSEALKPEGMNVIHSAGRAASQTVFHAHVHLVPRWADDRFGDIWPQGDLGMSETRNEIADLVRSELSR